MSIAPFESGWLGRDCACSTVDQSFATDLPKTRSPVDFR